MTGVQTCALPISLQTTAGAHEDHCTELVRYPSRLQAVIDVAAGVARQDLRRAWAWRQLGLWPAREQASPSEALSLLTRVLVREPVMIVSVFRALAGLGLIERLARRFDSNQWTAVARAAARRPDLPLEGWKGTAGAGVGDPDEAPHAAALARRLVRSSMIARSLRVVPVPPPARRALAALVVMEVEPVFAATPRDRLPALLDAMEVLLAADETPQLDVRDAAADDLAPSESGVSSSEDSDCRADLQTENRAQSLRDLRRHAFTDYGGLLFLLPLLDRFELPARIPETFPNRPFRWTIHALGRALTPASSEDPAVLAFAGLPPDASPPDRDEPPLSPAEHEALTAVVQETLAELQRCLPHVESGDQELIEFVCGRRAEVVGEPGWIEARFSLDDVSTDLRRAALDLDPGYVPWLGVVVKFVYE